MRRTDSEIQLPPCQERTDGKPSGNIQIFFIGRFSERLQPHWGSLTITAIAGSYRQIPQKVLLTRYRGRSTFVLPTPGSVTPFRARSA